jgi:hypothetical protein
MGEAIVLSVILYSQKNANLVAVVLILQTLTAFLALSLCKSQIPGSGLLLVLNAANLSAS